MRIGFDFDGTVTKNPFIFKILIEALSIKHEVFLISGTAIKDYDKLLQELTSYNISEDLFKEIILKDEYGDINDTTKWKVSVIDSYKIRLYIENRFDTAKEIQELCNVLYLL